MLDEVHDIQGLSQQVCWLFLCVNWEDLDEAQIDPLPEVIVLLIDVPSLWAHLGYLGQEMDSSSIVLKELAVDD
jgi:hypothetical protein